MGTFFIITIVMVAICIQVYFLQDSVKKTNLQKNIFSDKGRYRSARYYIPANEFGYTSYEELKNKGDFYTTPIHGLGYDLNGRGEKEEISLVDIASNNDIGKEIESSVNNYLIRNKGLASDFSIIKDIVERNCTMLEDEIDTQTPFPLYIG